MILKTKVGHYYTPIDNSWGYCLQDGYNHYLAGTLSPHKEPQTVTIIKGPYYLKKKWVGRFINLKFVTVKCEKGLLHEILYHGRD